MEGEQPAAGNAPTRFAAWEAMSCKRKEIKLLQIAHFSDLLQIYQIYFLVAVIYMIMLSSSAQIKGRVTPILSLCFDTHALIAVSVCRICESWIGVEKWACENVSFFYYYYYFALQRKAISQKKGGGLFIGIGSTQS